ncbi:MAG: hypothetical protein KC505_01380 [Myxococcales bacterium]|nr:hypothetical protein [Myxococcales bacterium]USN51409.1 MAG: hypothetical protein H6731_03095 [Myxococcales bacterium]
MKFITILSLTISALYLSNAFAEDRPLTEEERRQALEICLELKKLGGNMDCSEYEAPIPVEKVSFAIDNLLYQSTKFTEEKVSSNSCPMNGPQIEQLIEKTEELARVRKRDKVKAKLKGWKDKFKSKCGF